MGTPYLGEIKIVAFNFPPKGWALCNGQLLPINQNQALFSLLGTMYGGNGVTTFALPDLRGKAPVHFGPTVSQGSSGGEERHTLIVSEIPQHTHQASGNSGNVNSGTPLGGTWGAQAANSYGSAAPDVLMGSTTTNPTGGSQSHDNMQPYLVLTFVIALQGVYPSRP
jgi:microcystin-dependent protein